ncbi:MAG: hypothetical protein ACYDAZ_07570 [Thermoplasmataceae archaeon]
MTRQWKSETSNFAFGRIMKGTAYVAMAMLKLQVYEQQDVSKENAV